MKYIIKDGELIVGKPQLYDKDELHIILEKEHDFYKLSMDERVEIEKKLGINVNEERIKKLRVFILEHIDEISSIRFQGKFTIDSNYIEEIIKDTNIKKIRFNKSNVHGNLGEDIKKLNIIIDFETLKEILDSKDRTILEGNVGVTSVSISELNEYKNKYKLPIKGLIVEFISEISEESLELISPDAEIKLKDEIRKPYSIEEIKKIIESISNIKKSIPENAEEFEKFMTVYCMLAEFIDYDDTGNKNSKEYTEENCYRTRSLYSAIVDGQACCVGYAIALEQVLNYVGIEAKIISSENHARNIVQIGEKWYETDLTWDSDYIIEGEYPKYCLIKRDSDENFIADEFDEDTIKLFDEANENYDAEKIFKFVEKFMEGRARKRRGISCKDLKENSVKTTITNIFEKLRKILIINKEHSEDEQDSDGNKEIRYFR